MIIFSVSTVSQIREQGRLADVWVPIAALIITCALAIAGVKTCQLIH